MMCAMAALQDGERVDVVVVGAGAAGAVVAARASEDPDRRVVLLEAGPDYPLAAALPADLLDGHDNSYTAHDWGLDYVPVSARADRTDRFPRGRVTGGSTAVNTTIALRGTPADYDGWAALGNPAWAWASVLPAFNRLERDLDFGTEPYHGDAGPISIRRFTDRELVPTQAAFLDACAAAGHPRCDDVNAPDAVGAAVMAVNKLGRLRISVAIGYLAAARFRPNLHIEAGATVRRVLFEGRRACGVELEPDPSMPSGTEGGPRRILADVVVLCAGAVHTPGVLVRSGIGPAAELARFGIEPVQVAEGVGACLQDHPALAVVCLARHPELCAADLPLVQTITRYTAAGSDRPLDVNIELITRARWGGNRHEQHPRAFLLAPSLEQVQGRGRLRQTGTDPAARPIIEPNFGVDPIDVARHVAAWRDAIALAGTAPLRDFVAEVVFPDPARARTDDELARLAATVSASGYHPSCTAHMGPPDDPLAVVDQYGRCYGVDGLVVADASIMPFVPRANTNLTSIMIGEMIGEWLRREPDRYRV
ncbi:MAG: GMC family oxidoreductase [Acidimicrobiales bacterium]|nr:GMC family oxidoreductase [Acidimicrobiales bacterium]